MKKFCLFLLFLAEKEATITFLNLKGTKLLRTHQYVILNGKNDKWKKQHLHI